MFSFIKWLENLFEKIKKNKGLMFTMLSIVSVVGIFLSLYFVNFMVKDVAYKTFHAERKKFSKELRLLINQEKDNVLSIATIATLDSELIDVYKNITTDGNETNESTPQKTLKSISKKFTSTINKNLSRDDLQINFYETSKSDGDEIVNGLIVTNKGAFFQAKIPFAMKNNSYLKVDVKSNISSLIKTYKQLNKTFVFLLNDSSINRLDRTVFKKLYFKITNDYAIKSNIYSKDTINNLQKLDFQTLLEKGYIRDKDNFYVVNSLHDSDGNEIGLALIIEKIDDDSIVKLVKSLVNNVTLVALGLIVSMILFLF